MRHKTNYRAARGNSPPSVTLAGTRSPSPRWGPLGLGLDLRGALPAGPVEVEREGGSTPAGEGFPRSPLGAISVHGASSAAVEPEERPTPRVAPARPRSAAAHYNSQKAARAATHSELL